MTTFPPRPLASPWDFEPLAATLDGSLVTAADPGWEQASGTSTPEAVLFARSVADVTRVITFARRRALRVTTQRTGARAGPAADLSGTVLLRTTGLRAVSVDHAARTVRAEAGASWDDVDAALEPYGLLALAASGRGNGIVGSVLDGDFGWLGREHGLTAASVSAIEIVTGDGVHRRVDAARDTELYWALRGGGGSFGVVTAVELAARRHSAVLAGALEFPLTRAREVIEAWERWTRSLPDAATTAVRLPVHDAIVIEGAFASARADVMLGPLRALEPARDTFRAASRPDRAGLEGEASDGLVLDVLDSAAIESLVRAAETLAIEVRQLGGALGRPGAGALERIPGRFLLTASAAPGGESDIRSLLDELAPQASAFELPTARQGPWVAEQTHSPETLARLRSIRAAVDPTSIMRSPRALD
ncbi:MAG: oxidoreductase [Rhodoglobus sp.]|nr:oxidoreductase [Rhodoglobus sp.]